MPLFGTIVRDTVQDHTIDEAAVRAAVDPVYPPVLVHSLASRTHDGQRKRSLFMLFGVQGNRRDGVGVLDGGGEVLWIDSADSDAFRGTFGPGGMVASDTGYFCATRVRR
jgi:hypothetical protein